MEAKQCLECGEQIFGRSDKKFCNEACRCTYHNRLNGPQSEFIRQVNRNLHRNRKILEALIQAGKNTVKRSYLLRLGFDFQVITTIQNLNEEVPFYFCYEFGYQPLDEQHFRILTQEEIEYF